MCPGVGHSSWQGPLEYWLDNNRFIWTADGGHWRVHGSIFRIAGSDHWFWTRYTAYSCECCQHKCLSCYCGEERYCRFEDLNEFGCVVQVEENSPDLLHRALSRAPVDLLGTGEPNHRVWAYRKAAWAIEDTPQDLGLIYRVMGRKGLESIENVGPSIARKMTMAAVVEGLIKDLSGV